MCVVCRLYYQTCQIRSSKFLLRYDVNILAEVVKLQGREDAPPFYKAGACWGVPILGCSSFFSGQGPLTARKGSGSRVS